MSDLPNHKILIESVQKRFTRILCQRSNVKFSSYQDRLKFLHLKSLETRRIKRDLVLMFKILNGLIDVNYTDFFQINSFNGYNLRRHDQQICRQEIAKTSVRTNFFTNRVIKYWNQLPQSVIESKSLAIFKRKLYDFLLDL